ncbi:ABC transporter permease [Planosporangium thailandense]|uniref:ABC transporter permease n=1 Tax=Planosporangium thailandense TaxID=765197 RepID=A0ABX0Y045_9ACTN|nr:ABC transporter permease [Planosporangium thailandense]NJC71527.1 ABC transporter permease [Planosporangium thailandense]
MAHRLWRWVADHWVLVIGLLVLAYLFVPIGVVAAMSFRESGHNAPYTLQNYHFTLRNWAHPFGAGGIQDAFLLSIGIAALSTVGATILGTLMSFALARHTFRGRSATNALIFLPMATPEIVMGSSLLALFVAAGVPLGFWTIVIAHIMFCLSFVVVTVKARLAGLDPRLQEAAMDLYADERQTFLRVTLPLVMPGIVAAALLSFSLSFDDFIVTNFNSGSLVTFPMYIWGAAQRGIPPQINVIGTAMFAISFLLVLAGQLRSLRRRSA